MEDKNCNDIFVLIKDKSDMKKCGFRGGSFMGDPYDPAVSNNFT